MARRVAGVGIGAPGQRHRFRQASAARAGSRSPPTLFGAPRTEKLCGRLTRVIRSPGATCTSCCGSVEQVAKPDLESSVRRAAHARDRVLGHRRGSRRPKRSRRSRDSRLVASTRRPGRVHFASKDDAVGDRLLDRDHDLRILRHAAKTALDHRLQLALQCVPAARMRPTNGTLDVAVVIDPHRRQAAPPSRTVSIAAASRGGRSPQRGPEQRDASFINGRCSGRLAGADQVCRTRRHGH